MEEWSCSYKDGGVVWTDIVCRRTTSVSGGLAFSDVGGRSWYRAESLVDDGASTKL